MQKCRAPSAWLWDSRVSNNSIQPTEEGELDKVDLFLLESNDNL
jgi:hypothetical protein